MVKVINILGVTGSIGQAAADVIEANSDQFKVNLISAHSDEVGLVEMAERLGAQRAVLTSKDNLNDYLDESVDITLCAIAGMAGLPSMLEAIKCSKAVAVANKEPLVAAGPQVMKAIRDHGTDLLPVDSEHNAIFQVFDFKRRSEVKKIILTASGGPFRTWSLDEMAAVSVEQALAHPNWSMGKKISIDSATMMNKALEVIEAHYLFELPPEQIDVLIHPQSIIHSMVEYIDGSVLAQMGASDMRTPISNVLAWPERLSTPGQTLDMSKIKTLSFEESDTLRFPALKFAYECLRSGQSACVTFNSANEVAVGAFLTNRIGFLDIMDCIEHTLQSIEDRSLKCVEDIKEFDKTVRAETQTYINKITTKVASAS